MNPAFFCIFSRTPSPKWWQKYANSGAPPRAHRTPWDNRRSAINLHIDSTGDPWEKLFPFGSLTAIASQRCRLDRVAELRGPDRGATEHEIGDASVRLVCGQELVFPRLSPLYHRANEPKKKKGPGEPPTERLWPASYDEDAFSHEPFLTIAPGLISLINALLHPIADFPPRPAPPALNIPERWMPVMIIKDFISAFSPVRHAFPGILNAWSSGNTTRLP